MTQPIEHLVFEHDINSNVTDVFTAWLYDSTNFLQHCYWGQNFDVATVPTHAPDAAILHWCEKCGPKEQAASHVVNSIYSQPRVIEIADGVRDRIINILAEGLNDHNNTTQ